MESFTIGRLARKANVNIETVRYYERRGLLPKPVRTESGYRQYTETDVARLHFIRQAKDLGFTLKEIAELLSLKLDDASTCGEVKQLTAEKIATVESKIADLLRIKKVLQDLLHLCDKTNATSTECPILEALDVPHREARSRTAGAKDVAT